MLSRRFSGTAVLIAVALAVGSASVAAPATQTSTLVAIRAAHHPNFDRLVFEFTGPLPTTYSVTRVPQIIGDGSGLPIPVAGDALLAVRFYPAAGHDDSGHGTYGPIRRTYPLPGLIEVANSGDFEAVLSFGVGLATSTSVRTFTLTNPSRVVVDLDTTFPTITARAYFLDRNRFATGIEPYVRAIARPVIPPAVAHGALQRLFAGPTPAERAAGLEFIGSDATGFTKLSIVNGIARVRLVGGCNSHGSTFTIADEIFPTLRQFPSVRWVKIYDTAGRTGNPTGPVDSIPDCLNP